MQENVQQHPIILFLRKIWPYVSRVINTVLYFIISLIKNFFKIAMQMIKGN
ncbi:MAG: hypothetical protein H0W89_01325 [Candidatus Levybacteria bacterium]|nr:hypothetical protein [Candidatus Levybacteria bacterium]